MWKNREKLIKIEILNAADHSIRHLFQIPSVWTQQKYHITYVEKIGLIEQAVYAPFSAAISYPLKIVTVLKTFFSNFYCFDYCKKSRFHV